VRGNEERLFHGGDGRMKISVIIKDLAATISEEGDLDLPEDTIITIKSGEINIL